MGCDIHAVFQAKREGRWVDIASKYDERRHYFLFAWLAAVRNGFGFAGTPAHDPITPIATPRGWPHGFDPEQHLDSGGNPLWADHSESWLTADEILAAPLPSGVMCTGVVTRAVAEAWDAASQPESWCGAISGPGVSVAASLATMVPTTTHVRIEWPMPTTELDYFIDEIRRLRDELSEVRMVFGFDS